MNSGPIFPAACVALMLGASMLNPVGAATAGAQWLPAGIRVPGGRGDIPAICRDSIGGLLVAWRGSPPNIFVQRLLASGTVAPGWPDSALRASSAVGD